LPFASDDGTTGVIGGVTMQHGDHHHDSNHDLDHDDDAGELGWDELDAEMSSSAREASMGFGTLLEIGATPAPGIFAEALRRRTREVGRRVPARYRLLP
jgi:hypothetical protein